jgi:pyridoxamine 5'-phosphate oxidase
MSYESRFTSIREEYRGTPLDRETIADDPFVQLAGWMDDVLELDIPLANAMTLATADATGQPSARIVLLKGFDERGLVFFSNYSSRKGRELEDNPKAALLLWWQPLQRQIRIEGVVERTGRDESDAYFSARPRASNLSAMGSPQSQVIPGREWLETRVAELDAGWADEELVRPEDWGGYRLVPRAFEFWQGRADRLHDRMCYSLDQSGRWRIDRLAP